jgi:hypothetical protein
MPKISGQQVSGMGFDGCKDDWHVFLRRERFLVAFIGETPRTDGPFPKAWLGVLADRHP